MTVATGPVTAIPPVPRHPRLQRFYLFLGVAVLTSVVYFSSVKSHSTPESLGDLYDRDIFKVTKAPNAPQPPNLLLVLTDDQDSVLLGASQMPLTNELVGARGAVLSNAFVASPLCCPSRASLYTGRYVHNHGTMNNSFAGHCADEYWQNGPEKESIATHLHSAGYQTFFSGKYMNKYGFDRAGGVEHVPPGWDSWSGLKGNSVYYNYTLSANGTAEEHGYDPEEDYLTKVIWRRAKQFLETIPSGDNDGTRSSDPFFMLLSTPAAHAPYTPEPKYADRFADHKAPRTLNFNVVNDETKHWLLRLGEQPLSDEHVERVDEIYRDRLRTLLTVDEMVADVIGTLEEKGLLDNTYIVFTSDNGYHLGQFSMPFDKRQPYEFDIRVPLMIRGPGITAGSVIPYATVNVDLAPTLLDLAGVAVPDYMDGVSLTPLLFAGNDSTREFESFPIEHTSKINALPLDYSGKPLDNSVGKRGSQSRANFNSTDFFARRTILIEHPGERSENQYGDCEGVGSGMWACLPTYGCKCADSANNTYACVRQFFVPETAASTLTKGDKQRNHYDIEQNQGMTSWLDFSNWFPLYESKSEGIDTYEFRGLTTSENSNVNAGLDVTPVKDVIYCEWADDEDFIEFYDLSDDSDQLHNSIHNLTDEVREEYHVLLASMTSCLGESCLIR